MRALAAETGAYFFISYVVSNETKFRNEAVVLTPSGEFLDVYGKNHAFGEQLWTNSVFRAVENRVAIVFTGVAHNTALIDPYGRLLALELNPEGERLTLVMDVPLGTGDAPLVRMGDWLGWFSLAGYIFFMIFESVVGKRAKKTVKS